MCHQSGDPEWTECPRNGQGMNGGVMGQVPVAPGQEATMGIVPTNTSQHCKLGMVVWYPVLDLGMKERERKQQNVL